MAKRVFVLQHSAPFKSLRDALFRTKWGWGGGGQEDFE